MSIILLRAESRKISRTVYENAAVGEIFNRACEGELLEQAKLMVEDWVAEAKPFDMLYIDDSAFKIGYNRAVTVLICDSKKEPEYVFLSGQERRVVDISISPADEDDDEDSDEDDNEDSDEDDDDDEEEPEARWTPERKPRK